MTTHGRRANSVPVNREPAREVFIKESIYGPVTGTVTGQQANRTPSACDRSTRGREPEGELAFSDFDSNRVHSPSSSSKPPTSSRRRSTWPTSTAKTSPTSRPGGCRSWPPKPTRRCRRSGPGRTTGKGFLSLAEHPHVILARQPEAAQLEQQARSRMGLGVGKLLLRRAAPGADVQRQINVTNGKKAKLTEARTSAIMNKAATQDFRAIQVWPTIQKVLEKTPAPSELAAKADKMILKWIKSGASLLREGTARRPPRRRSSTPSSRRSRKPCMSPVLGETAARTALDRQASTTGPTAAAPRSGAAGTATSTRTSARLLGESVARTVQPRLLRQRQPRNLQQIAVGGDPDRARKRGHGRTGHQTRRNGKPRRCRSNSRPAAAPNIEIPWTNRSTFQQVIEFTTHQEEDLEGPHRISAPRPARLARRLRRRCASGRLSRRAGAQAGRRRARS